MSVNYLGVAIVLNCGSSSVKYQVIDTTVDQPLAAGIVERVTDHAGAILSIIDTLAAPGSPVDLQQVTAVGHRVVQGGAEFTAPTIISDDVERHIAMLSTLAPLHNPPNLAGITAARRVFPQVPHVAVFDTAFHSTIPRSAYTYAIDRHVAEEHGIRKYGFHGTSHSFVSREAARLMGKDPHQVNLITLHLGNGASACAVRSGRSIDTSMGLTPLQGLVMGTRSGDIDPAITLHLSRTAGMSIDDVDDLLNRQSGMLGLCGYSDMRDVEQAAADGNADAQLALEVYCRRIRGYVGQYYAQLGTLDAVVFTAGVGENSDTVRLQAMAGLSQLGIVMDPDLNRGRKATPTLVSAEESRIQVWVIPTNEEREIALQTIAAVS